MGLILTDQPAPLEFLVAWFAWAMLAVFVVMVVWMVLALAHEHLTTKWLP